jgi:N-acetylglutamate synthase-like GNAT family acetyltransferase
MFSVRPSEVEDINGIQQVARTTWLETYKGIYPDEFIHNFLNNAYSETSLERSIRRDMGEEERKFFVAINEKNEIVGYAHAMNEDGRVYELLRIYVLPQYHGKGIGTLLIKELRSQIKNLEKLKAWVEKENIVGRMFYENKGFQVIEEKLETLEGKITKLICYEKDFK